MVDQMNPALSILVCSVSDRLDRLHRVYAELVHQASPVHPIVEVLVLTDNRCRSIGLKRQALLDVARGKYICFVDDDDEVSASFTECVIDAVGECPDVVVFPTTCAHKDLGSMLVEHSIQHDNEEARIPSFKRKPWFMHPVRRDIAQASRFPDMSWGEDAAWLSGVWSHLRHEVPASEDPLYTYNWDDGKSNPDKPTEA